jgi:autotransporter-associated beta strand protein
MKTTTAIIFLKTIDRFTPGLCVSAGLLAAITLLSAPSATFAGSATWDLNPGSGDWNTATNWTPMIVPNGSSDTATFALSNTTAVSISANTEVNSIIFTPAATSPYTITANPGFTLTISGVGITNNSGRTQTFVTADDSSGNFGTVVFSKSATAGSNISIFNEGGSINFFNRSSAGSATIENDFSHDFASTNFFDSSTAGNALILDFSSSTTFFDRSSAGSASIETGNGFVIFLDNSTAGSAFIGVSDDSLLQFTNTSSAGSAFIGATGFVGFFDFSSAARATINTQGFLSFDGSSTGGTARIELQSSDFEFIGVLDISGHNAPGVTIGSIEGDANTLVFLGANNLTVGTNNLSTTFSGVMQGAGGSLTKIGSGTLVLAGANTYTGDTNVNRGVLQVDGSITSNTFVNHGGTLAGTGTINGNVTNTGRISPGDAPGILTIDGNYTQASNGRLLIDIAGANNGQFSVLDVLGSADLDGFLHPMLLNGFTPTIGESFVFLDYASLTGAFSGINNQVFNNGTERWVVTYGPSEAVLTATKNVPDQGSTFLLLTLGLLGLVTSRHFFLRKQA